MEEIQVVCTRKRSHDDDVVYSDLYLIQMYLRVAYVVYAGVVSYGIASCAAASIGNGETEEKMQEKTRIYYILWDITRIFIGAH